MENKLSELINQIVADYFHFYNCEPINLSIIFSDDIWKTYFEIRPDHRSKRTEQLPSFNGTIAAPLELDGTFTVIVDNQYFLRLPTCAIIRNMHKCFPPPVTMKF